MFQLCRNDVMRIRTDVETTYFDHLIGPHKNDSLRSFPNVLLFAGLFNYLLYSRWIVLL